MASQLEKEVRFLKRYVITATVGVLALATLGATFQGREKFEEIDVERINVVEKDGKLRMVISNRERQHPGMVDGKLIPRKDGRPPGLIFFNHRGDECGGLIFDENGGKGHFVSLTMDKSRQDQTIGMQHLESDNGEYFAGLRIWDRPHSSMADSISKYDAIQKMPDKAAQAAAMQEMRDKGEFGAQRITIGKLRNKSALIALCDANGQPRIQISVDATGNPTLSFLDENGGVISTLPEETKAGDSEPHEVGDQEAE